MNIHDELIRVIGAYRELSKAWEIDPMGDRYRKADEALDDALMDALKVAQPEADPPEKEPVPCAGIVWGCVAMHCPGCALAQPQAQGPSADAILFLEHWVAAEKHESECGCNICRALRILKRPAPQVELVPRCPRCGVLMSKNLIVNLDRNDGLMLGIFCSATGCGKGFELSCGADFAQFFRPSPPASETGGKP